MQSRMRLKNMVFHLRQWLVWIVATAGIGAAVYFVAPALVPHTLVQAQINEQIGRWTGGAFRLRAGAKITVARGFRVTVSDPAFVSLNEIDAAPVVTADSISAPLRLLPLLLGRVEIAQLVLVRPDIDLRRPDMHFSKTTNPDTVDQTAPQLGDVILVDGTLRLRGAMGGHQVSGLNLRLGGDAVTNAVAIQGGVFVGARHLRVDLQVDDLRALVSDAGSQAKLNVRLGARRDSDEGDVAASAQGLPYEIIEKARQAADRFGLPWGGFGALTAEGTLSVTPQAVSMFDAHYSLGGVKMQGHMRAQTAGLPVFAQLLGLPDAVHALVAEATNMTDRRWVDAPVSMAWLDGLDLDIALVQDTSSNATPTRDAAAVSLTVGNGTTSFDLAGHIEGFGQMQTKIALEHQIGAPVKMMASGRVDTMSVANITQLLATMGPPPLIGTAQLPEGLMNGTFDVRANGRTLGQIVNSMNGSVTAQLKGGSLVGADLVATLETLVKGREFMTEEHGPLIPAAGRTQFDQLDARVDLASGIANVSRVSIEGERFGINMLGEVQLTQGTMNVGGNAVLLSTPDAGARSTDTLVDLPFGVGGTVFGLVVAAGVPKVTTARPETKTDADN